MAVTYGSKPLSCEYTGIIAWTNSVICHVDVSDVFVAPIYDKLLQRMEQGFVVQVSYFNALVELIWLACGEYNSG